MKSARCGGMGRGSGGGGRSTGYVSRKMENFPATEKRKAFSPGKWQYWKLETGKRVLRMSAKG